MSKYDDQTHCENLDCVDQLEISQAGYQLNNPHTKYQGFRPRDPKHEVYFVFSNDNLFLVQMVSCYRGGGMAAVAIREGEMAAVAIREGEMAAIAIREGEMAAIAIREGDMAAIAIREVEMSAVAIREGEMATVAIRE